MLLVFKWLIRFSNLNHILLWISAIGHSQEELPAVVFAAIEEPYTIIGSGSSTSPWLADVRSDSPLIGWPQIRFPPDWLTSSQTLLSSEWLGWARPGSVAVREILRILRKEAVVTIFWNSFDTDAITICQGFTVLSDNSPTLIRTELKSHTERVCVCSHRSAFLSWYGTCVLSWMRYYRTCVACNALI